jgi:PKD-like domain/Metallo-peptidase family M12/Secretion system C-terminal sorting domain
MKWIVALTILLLNAVIVFGREGTTGKISERVAQLQQQNVFTNEFQLFSVTARSVANDLSKTITNYTLLNTNSRVADVINTKPDFIKILVPLDNGARTLPLLLYKVDISPNGFTLMTSDGKSFPADRRIVNYRGAIEGDMNSIAAITISDNELMGMISTDEGNYVLGKLDNSSSHVIYNDKDLVKANNFNCGTDGSVNTPGSEKGGTNTTTSVKCVNWYYEVDNDVYVGKQSNIATVNTYINGIFNQVATLYANDGFTITLQTLYVWTTTDPYTGPSTSNYLSQFGTNRTSFAGDLATLIGYAGGGGVAYVNGFCNSQSKYKQSYCGISSTFNNVPTYSWTVEVVAHEQGHLFGSSHTHDCVWNGNNTAIDGCGPTAGYAGNGSCATGPLPTSSVGGTIMSYCHLVSGVGIKFVNGFGPQPTAVMLSRLNNASCLVACCATPAQPGTISGSASACQGTNQTYSIAAVSGATSYTWTLPSGSTGTSTTTSITISLGGTSGNISVTANSSCGSGTARTLAITISPLPAQPVTITGNASTCPATSQSYSVAAVSGATSYTWTLPSGWSGTSTTNSITTTSGSAGGNITVKANNACGSSAVRTLAVTISSVAPAQPGTISGSASVCPSSSQTYSVAAVSGATSYTWTLPSGWGGTSTTNSITTSSGTAGGTVSVKANNGCGSSAVRTLTVAISALPAQPSAITGLKSGICNQSSVSYSINNVAGVTYNWSFSTGGASIASGQGTNTITVNYAAYTTGSLTVTGNNSCGAGAARTVTVKSAPATPVAITGAASVCANQQGVPYSIPAVANTSSYKWVGPAGSHVSDGTTTSSGTALTTTATSVTVNFGNTAGIVQVRATNSCGDGNYRKLTVSFGCRTADDNTETIEESFRVYPNPATDKLNVVVNANDNATVSLKLFDISGRILISENRMANEGVNTFALDINHLSKGIYLLEINNDSNIQKTKVVVE